MSTLAAPSTWWRATWRSSSRNSHEAGDPHASPVVAGGVQPRDAFRRQRRQGGREPGRPQAPGRAGALCRRRVVARAAGRARRVDRGAAGGRLGDGAQGAAAGGAHGSEPAGGRGGGPPSKLVSPKRPPAAWGGGL